MQPYLPSPGPRALPDPQWPTDQCSWLFQAQALRAYWVFEGGHVAGGRVRRGHSRLLGTNASSRAQRARVRTLAHHHTGRSSSSWSQPSWERRKFQAIQRVSPQAPDTTPRALRELGWAGSRQSCSEGRAPALRGQRSRHRRGCFCRRAFFRALRATLAASRKTSSTFSRNLAEHSR